MVFRCPNIQAHYNEAVLCLNFGTPENNEFSIWDKWNVYYFWVSQYLSKRGAVVEWLEQLGYGAESRHIV